jgi:tetratricopeptide (TPR) repeat protein
MRRAARIAVPLVAGALSFAAAVAAEELPRSAFDNAGKVRGPLSDFWFKIRSEWSGYMETEGDLPEGGGYVRNRTFSQPGSTSVWVSLVHGDLAGGSKQRSPMAQLQEEFLSEWKKAEARNWPYAQVFSRTWDQMGEPGRRQNIIMVGTPWTLAPVGPLARSLGFEISPGRIEIGRRRYHGDNLVLVFIAPNPSNPERYALVVTGTTDEALLQAIHLPYGDTDYVLFRGRRLLESGHFDKSDADAWAPPRSYEAAGSHRGFAIRESAHYVFWYENGRLSREDLDELSARKEAAHASLVSMLPPLPDRGDRITWYLYPSIDRKIDETEREEPSHVDWAAGEIHTVYSRVEKVTEPWLDLMVLIHRSIGPTRVPRLERALALALAPTFEGRDLETLAGPVFRELLRRESAVLKSLRDQDVMTPADGPPGPHDLLLAAFLKDCIRRHGRDKTIAFVRQASPGSLEDVFARLYDVRLGEALDRWAAALPGVTPLPLTRASAASVSGQPDPRLARAKELLLGRRDDEAASLLEQILADDPFVPAAQAMLARARFRRSDFVAAEAAARRAIELCAADACADPDGPATAGWSRLTLGRIEALKGRRMAAHVELTHPDIVAAPAPIPTLAAYWLETMGESRNQLTVVSHLKTESRVALRKLEWARAEAQLKRALEIDPSDGEAHRLLSDVYHRQHEYWAWRVRFLNQTHPDYNVLSRTYFPGESTTLTRVEMLHSLDSFNDLVLKGNLELMKAQSLYAAEIQNLHAEGDRFLIEKRDIGEALSTYQRALALNEDFFLSHFLVGRCFFLLDRDDQATASFEQVLRHNPSDPLVLAWTHTYLGYLALKRDDLDGAKHAFHRALAAAPEGKAADLAREGLGKVDTIRLLLPEGSAPR